ncbi:uncharacterized protein LOC129889175 isoform X2 [Solanum dulcamara]|uniref:uncharacterized protein LOC129889175 isoform X2 n=1 Tax=Solanum dulcamara TaxID=45834 RepID=UPI0024855BD4|nr:uncharacterized protein LOC129889175 isoform X2 [Solanum dulcamara]
MTIAMYTPAHVSSSVLNSRFLRPPLRRSLLPSRCHRNFSLTCALLPEKRRQSRRLVNIALGVLLQWLALPKDAVGGSPFDKYVKSETAGKNRPLFRFSLTHRITVPADPLPDSAVASPAEHYFGRSSSLFLSSLFFFQQLRSAPATTPTRSKRLRYVRRGLDQTGKAFPAKRLVSSCIFWRVQANTGYTQLFRRHLGFRSVSLSYSLRARFYLSFPQLIICAPVYILF